MDALDTHKHLITIALAAVLAAGIAFFVAGRNDGPAPLQIVSGEAEPGQPIEVHVTGAVAAPGVYQLEGGARAIDALNAAGGPAGDADLEAINLSLRLRDEDQVLVPHIGEGASAAPSVGDSFAGVININTATADELDTLPGIGEVYSARIVESRETVGPYASLEDLLARDIIPRATFEKIYGLITVGP
jgi:competence protein ComEA